MSSTTIMGGSPLMEPGGFFRSFWCHQSLTYSKNTREVIGRYCGSVFGLLCSLLNPFQVPAVYSFLFRVVFKTRRNTGSDSKTEFSMWRFADRMILRHDKIHTACRGVFRSPSEVNSGQTHVADDFSRWHGKVANVC